MCRPSIPRWRIRYRLILPSRLHHLCHHIIDFQYLFLRPVASIFLFILPLNNRECLHDIVHIIMLYFIKMEIEGIQLAPYEKSPFFIPYKWWAVLPQSYKKTSTMQYSLQKKASEKLVIPKSP